MSGQFFVFVMNIIYLSFYFVFVLLKGESVSGTFFLARIFPIIFFVRPKNSNLMAESDSSHLPVTMGALENV